MTCSNNSANTKHEAFETYSIFWLDASVNNPENLNAQKKLRNIISQLQVFLNPENCMDGIHSIYKGDFIILIVSGQMGRIVVPEMHTLEQVCSIYVYCFDREANLTWSQPYKKIKAVCNKLDEMIDLIQLEQKHRSRNDEPLTMNILNRTSTELNGEFLHIQLLMDVLIRMKSNKKDQNELINFLKNEYNGNQYQLKLVKEFNEKYESNTAIWWYTRDSFVYRLLNTALRRMNVDMIFLFRTLIRDIYEQLRINQCQDRETVYRGQIMSSIELKHLQKSIGKLISINCFFSTSLRRSIAEKFLKDNTESCALVEHVPIIFEIDADPRVIYDLNGYNRRPFSKISHLSEFTREDEILFMIGSIFRLDKIFTDQLTTVVTIQMTLCGDDDNDLKHLYDHMRHEKDVEQTNLVTLGDVMFDMGQFDLAEKYYRRWLKEISLSDPSLGALYQRIGMVSDVNGDYDRSLEWYQMSLEIQKITEQSDYVGIGLTHNSIGNAYRKKGDYHRALESYNHAVSLFKQVHDDNHPKMAIIYNNIGLIYQEQKKYYEALDFYSKALAIDSKHLPNDHPDLGGSYNNIGIVHRCLGNYDLALENYNRSLKINLKSLHPHHPSIANIYRNMGLVYEDKNELEHALKLLNKAQEIFSKRLPSNNPDRSKLQIIIQRVESNIKTKK